MATIDLTGATQPLLYTGILLGKPAPLPLIHQSLDGASLLRSARLYCAVASPECGGFVAGGFIRDTLLGVAPRDMDWYLPDAEAAVAAGRRLADAGWHRIDRSIVADTWRQGRRRVQVITTSHDPSSCIERFDLTICCAALDLTSLKTTAAASFEDVLRQRKLVLHRPAFPVDTLRRIGRFLHCGYSIDGLELEKLHALIVREMLAAGQAPFRAQALNDAVRRAATAA